MPPVRIFNVEWDDGNLGHLSHSVSPDEVTQALLNASEMRRNPKKGGSARWAVTAYTNGNRRLFVLGNFDEDGASFRPITAWEV